VFIGLRRAMVSTQRHQGLALRDFIRQRGGENYIFFSRHSSVSISGAKIAKEKESFRLCGCEENAMPKGEGGCLHTEWKTGSQGL